MKRKKFTESQIIKALKEHEGGRDVQEICRKYGIHCSTFFNWRKKYGGMEVGDLKKLKELEAENRRLKQMFADLSLDHQILKEVLSGKI